LKNSISSMQSISSMKKISILFSVLSLFSIAANCQNTGIFAGNDTSVCNGGSLTLNATLNVLPNVSATGITLTDDQYSQIINLGFTFNFYGANYTQCLISTNGYITFDLSGAGGYSPWSINNACPNPGNPTNVIMGPWQDVNPGVGGSILYASFGTAPNRKFVVQWDNPMFSCTSLCFGNQIILYENGNYAETHIGNKPICSTWNGGQAIHGVQNATGTLAAIVAGRNAGSQWSTSMEGMRFTPQGNNYAISSVPFSPVFLGVQANSVITWTNAAGATIGTGATVTVNPTQNTFYVASVSSITCGGTAQSSSFTYNDTIFVNISNPVVTAGAQNADCLTGQGGILGATASGALAPFNFVWNTIPPTNSDSAFNVPVGTYTVTLTDANNCIATATATITQQGALNTNIISTTDLLCKNVPTGSLQVLGFGSTPPYTYFLNNDTSLTGIFSNLFAGTHDITIKDAIGCSAVVQVTLNEPAQPLSIVQTAHNNVSCFGNNDGSASFTASGGTAPYDFSSGITNSSTGNFNNLTANDYLFSVSDANGCFVTFPDTITEPQLLTVQIGSFSPVICYGQSNGTATAVVAGGVGPYFYNWNSNPVQNNPLANNLPAGNYTVQVSDNNGCTASNALTANADLFICQTFDTTLVAFASGGFGTLNFNWMPGNISNDSALVAPDITTIYTVTVTDSLGCTVSEDVEVTVYGSPLPLITKNASSGCQTFCPTFTDLTLYPPGSINAYREWDFGDEQTAKNDSLIDHCYNNPGSYAVTLTVITDKGCRKTVTWENYIEVFPQPIAAFTTNPTSTDIQNPIIQLANLSREADSYQWNFGDSDSLFSQDMTHHTYRDTGIFTIRLIAQNNHNCIDSAQAKIVILPYYTFYVPDAFTPNGDGLNDEFEIKGSYIQACNLEIFDRWGRVMFSRAGTGGISWDGANAPQGVYVYKIKMKDTQNQDFEYVGNVKVLR
jgi:gliding motility-associated-like protein